MRKILNVKYEDIISVQNLLKAWEEFLPGKRNKEDVCEFSRNLMENILSLHCELRDESYKHGGYKAFNISDPKPRNIHKAGVRDRLLHHAVYRILYPNFDHKFISDSYSCRLSKGTHRAIKKFEEVGRKISKNCTKHCWILKCDVRKFFASVDHTTLIEILGKHINDKEIIWLLENIISSFNTKDKIGVGLPLGNLTSQLLVNIYMNEFDQWMKHRMKIKFYIRYADDFVIFSQDKDFLLELIPKVADFLEEKLKLTLHSDKISLKTIYSGVDFLGWVHFPKFRVLRMSTKRRVLIAFKTSENLNSLISYSGFLMHGNQFLLKKKIEEKVKLLESKI